MESRARARAGTRAGAGTEGRRVGGCRVGQEAETVGGRADVLRRGTASAAVGYGGCLPATLRPVRCSRCFPILLAS
ncbi:unnamed protein product [Nesidiocoris tenuis]|uniref:Uncharacterized protein n=1 Tax=Nesidiocoris tenuis TaxID=355587 RepID=A0A6H5GN92_9HEMI|nr:unnamed protein product [Nesidiocoris tenuis]